MNTTSESLLFRLQQVDGRLDQTAWEEFVRLYTPLMFYWARKTGLNTADASDIVQDVITRVLEKLPGFSYDSSKSFRGWLRAITLNRYREIKPCGWCCPKAKPLTKRPRKPASVHGRSIRLGHDC